jgi:hypothetical protein
VNIENVLSLGLRLSFEECSTEWLRISPEWTDPYFRVPVVISCLAIERAVFRESEQVPRSSDAQTRLNQLLLHAALWTQVNCVGQYAVCRPGVLRYTPMIRGRTGPTSQCEPDVSLWMQTVDLPPMVQISLGPEERGVFRAENWKVEYWKLLSSARVKGRQINQLTYLPERWPLMSDDLWLLGFRWALRSESDFYLAWRRGDPAVAEFAANLVMYVEGQFRSVRDLVEECASHGWNSTIYEAWQYETAVRVRACARRVRGLGHGAGDLGACAIELWAKQLDVWTGDYREMREALAEAERAMYGDDWANAGE